MQHKWEEEKCYRIVFWKTPKERDLFEDKDIGGWIILKWILERYHGMI
jgi:hypothetical protein